MKQMPRKDPERKQKIIDFIKSQIEEKGYPPSVREICAALEIKSTSTVHAYLESLKKEGILNKENAKTRALKLVVPESEKKKKLEPEREYLELPILGTVTAGNPTVAYEEFEDIFPLPMQYARNQDMFMLRIKGDSMIDAGIYDKDLVIVQKQEVANNGDIVIALMDDEATCKRFFRENGRFRLQPENPALSPLILDEVAIIGKVIGLFRMFRG